jgi:hypothetical protein
VKARENLVIACAGDGSLHPGWLDDRADKDFDLFLVYYGGREGQWIDDADHYVARKGSKYELLSTVAESHAELIRRYQRIWLPDDDLRTNTANINRMFALFRDRGLALGQPALDRDSFVNVPLTRKMPFCRLRYTRFVEMMAPLFDRETFEKCRWTFAESRAAWGIDWIWVKTVNGDAVETDRVGILDAAAVTHTRKQDLGSGFYASLGADPKEEMETLLARHGLDELLKDMRSFFSHRMELSVFGLVLTVPGFQRARYRVWRVYRAASRRVPGVRWLGRAFQASMIGRRREPTIL